MLESPSKEQVLIQELLHKLDAERLKNARLESELSQYKEPAKMKKDLESRIKEQDIIIKKKDKTIDQLNQRMKHKENGSCQYQYNKAQKYGLGAAQSVMSVSFFTHADIIALYYLFS